LYYLVIFSERRQEVTMEWTGAERREGGSERMKVGKSVSIFAGDRRSILRARTRDLSTGGMRLDLDDGLGVGERILFRIDLGEGFDPAVQGGEVVWSEADQGTGVRFTAAGDVDLPGSGSAEPPDLPSAGDSVRLHIERMDHPLRVECVEAGPTGITVRTELPFLERGRTVRACYGDGDMEGCSEGILTSVSLESGDDGTVPGIRLRIRTTEEPEPEPEPEPVVEAAPVEEPWEEEEPTARDASPPEEIEPAEAIGEEPEEPAGPEEDAMSDAFQSLTGTSEEPDVEQEQSIEPQYVIVLRAVAAWMVASGRRGARLAATWTAEAWRQLLPLVRKAAPRILESTRRARDVVAPLAARITRGRRAAAASPRPTRMRKQKRRTTQASIVEKASTVVSSKARSRVLGIALLVAGLAGFGTGVWGVVSLITSGEDDGAEASSTGQDAAETAPGSFDMWGNAALPGGSVVEPSAAEIEMVETAAPAAVEAAPAVTEAPAVTPEPVAAVDVPPPGETPESSTGFYLGVNGEVTGYDYYALKSPPGLVVDVKGALPLKEGQQPVKRPGIKKVKAVARESGARFIIYFEGEKVPDFQVLPAGSSLEVRLDS